MAQNLVPLPFVSLHVRICPTLALILGLAATATATATAATPPTPLIVVLAPTGSERDGLQVLTHHPAPDQTRAVLQRGFAGTLLRLYALEQEYLRRHTARHPEPAYLLLSDRQGGFPQVGFWLDGEQKPDAGWVDLHRSSALAGRFGSMDQIFPHELLHVIVRQLAGEPRQSGGNQMHATAVRTDPVTAFSEGFAEHAQIMALDDADAAAPTRALRADATAAQRADAELAGYDRALTHRWWIWRAPALRFLVWFSPTEQYLRYAAVKSNAFARTPTIQTTDNSPESLYREYLRQSVLPGGPNGTPRSAGALLSTEGVVSHLFWKLATAPELQARYQDEPFYEQFGTTGAHVTPQMNVYLKLFAALADSKPSTTLELLRGYIRLFPGEAEAVRSIVRASLLGRDPLDAPEIWLLNDTFQTGSSLFDQFRSAPRVHTFDINAASEFDWMTVPGITAAESRTLVMGAPYESVEALCATWPPHDTRRHRILAMKAAAEARFAAGTHDADESLGLWGIVRSYLVRLVALIAVLAATGAWLARRTGARRWWTALLVALPATVTVIFLAWIVTGATWWHLVGIPLGVGAVPWAVTRWIRARSWRTVGMPFVVWGAATLPALVAAWLL